jgi:hypothetical protein
VRFTQCELMRVRVQLQEAPLTRMHTHTRHSLTLHHTSSLPMTHTQRCFTQEAGGADWFVLLRMVGEGNSLRRGVACDCDCDCDAHLQLQRHGAHGHVERGFAAAVAAAAV